MTSVPFDPDRPPNPDVPTDEVTNVCPACGETFSSNGPPWSRKLADGRREFRDDSDGTDTLIHRCADGSYERS